MNHASDAPLLLVEDSPEDVEALLRAFRKLSFDLPIARCEDGDEALDYLYQRGPYAAPAPAPRPAAVMLDLNLPGTDGRAVLAEMKRDPRLKAIPVIVFTSSDLREDVAACYRAGANCYVRKPVEVQAFQTAIQRLRDFWFGVVTLPTAV